jgi:hypothetical protein
VTAAVLGVLTLASSAGCGNVFNYLSDGLVRPDVITEIHILAGSGDVTYIPDDTVKGVDVRRRVRYLSQPPAAEATIHISGGVVTLQTDCGHNCGVSYEVRAPKGEQGIKVTGESGSGDVRLQGVSTVDLEVGSGNIEIKNATGAIRAKTGSGNITVTDVAGDAVLTTGSGDVEGRDLRGARTTVEVGSGQITLRLPGTGDASAVTSSGDIDVTVPVGTCEIVAETDSGDRNISVGAPTTANPHRVNLRTGSGDITVTPGL